MPLDLRSASHSLTILLSRKRASSLAILSGNVSPRMAPTSGPNFAKFSPMAFRLSPVPQLLGMV